MLGPARRVVLALLALCSALAAQTPQDLPSPEPDAQVPKTETFRYVIRESFLSVPNAFPRGLDIVEIFADRPGRHPLVVLTHGTSNKEEDREHVTPWSLYWPAVWFARRGYAAVVVVRKGYGRSGGKRDGESGGCRDGRFEEVGDASAEDLRAVAKALSSQPEIDSTQWISVGVSTGGFAQVALSANPPPQLKAALNFAGGRGGDGKENLCDARGLISSFHQFGKSAAKHGSLPMLWIYAQNDHWFPPSAATQFEAAYREGGGADQFVIAPPDGEDGHHLIYHTTAWSDTVTAFLKAHQLLPLGDLVLPSPPTPNIPPPDGLVGKGQEAWRRYLSDPPFKAFALANGAQWGLSAGLFDQDLADAQALERCRKAAGATGSSCHVVARTPAAGHPQ